MNCINRKTILAALLLYAGSLSGQTTKRVLFLGNSYTDVNNLPRLTSDLAASAGKTLIYDMHVPGGYYLGQHSKDPVSLAKIRSGNWDHVVLQDQSLAMAYPFWYLHQLPSSFLLDSIIKEHNLCAQILYYSTWGRKDGDTYLCSPPQCDTDTWISRTYYEMDSTIEMHYKVFADSIKASLTPVGAVWRHIRRNHPSIELFAADGSHPSLAGSYAAACCFYTTLFRSDPTLITVTSGLPPADAVDIRQAVKRVVYDSLLKWNVGLYDHLLDKRCSGLALEEETAPGEYWRVFPNPAGDVLCIRLTGNQANDQISICNALGAVIREIELLQTADIDISALPPGLYMIRSRNSAQQLKLLKK